MHIMLGGLAGLGIFVATALLLAETGGAGAFEILPVAVAAVAGGIAGCAMACTISQNLLIVRWAMA